MIRDLAPARVEPPAAGTGRECAGSRWPVGAARSRARTKDDSACVSPAVRRLGKEPRLTDLLSGMDNADWRCIIPGP
jgi:hypothetical protein